MSGTVWAVPRARSLGGDHRRRIDVFFGVALFLPGEKGWQRFVPTAGLARGSGAGRSLRRAQRFGKPAGAIQQPFGLLRHFRLLQVIDELRRWLALRLAHRLEDAALRDAAEIMVHCGPPAGLDPVEPHGAGEPIGMSETMLEPVLRDARGAVAVGFLVEGVDAITDS